MAVTKILARNAGLSQAIQYALNGDKTQERVLTAHLNCDPGREYQARGRKAGWPAVLSHHPVVQAGGNHTGIGVENRKAICY